MMRRGRMFCVLILFTWINLAFFHGAMQFSIHHPGDVDNMAGFLFLPVIYVGVIFLKVAFNFFCFWFGVIRPDTNGIKPPGVVHPSLFLSHRDDSLSGTLASAVGMLGMAAFFAAGILFFRDGNIMGVGYSLTRIVSILLYGIWIKSSLMAPMNLVGESVR